MGEVTRHQPVLRVLVGFSRYPAALEWARCQAEGVWGPAAMASEAFDFVETDYYEPAMGPGLKKTFLAFQRLADPGELADWKLQTNAWEAAYAQEGGHPVPRPLNLDPGYLTLGKFILASTKDHVHRIYLARGIFAEVTLAYQHHGWRPGPMTFPDFRRADYQEFLTRCRDYLHRRLREDAGS
ncbi:MAG: DUF4416 family protein [Pirellulales bacterium]